MAFIRKDGNPQQRSEKAWDLQPDCRSISDTQIALNITRAAAMQHLCMKPLCRCCQSHRRCAGTGLSAQAGDFQLWGFFAKSSGLKHDWQRQPACVVVVGFVLRRAIRLSSGWIASAEICRFFGISPLQGPPKPQKHGSSQGICQFQTSISWFSSPSDVKGVLFVMNAA